MPNAPLTAVSYLPGPLCTEHQNSSIVVLFRIRFLLFLTGFFFFTCRFFGSVVLTLQIHYLTMAVSWSSLSFTEASRLVNACVSMLSGSTRPRPLMYRLCPYCLAKSVSSEPCGGAKCSGEAFLAL